MSDRINTVTLHTKDSKREFGIEHAERILRMPKNGGWFLPKDSKFQFKKSNGITIRRNKGISKESN